MNVDHSSRQPVVLSASSGAVNTDNDSVTKHARLHDDVTSGEGNGSDWAHRRVVM